MAPEGTRMRQPCFSASRAHSSSTPTRAPNRQHHQVLARREHRGPELAQRGLGRRLHDQVGALDQLVERQHRVARGGRGLAHAHAHQRGAGNAPRQRLRDAVADDSHPDDSRP